MAKVNTGAQGLDANNQPVDIIPFEVVLPKQDPYTFVPSIGQGSPTVEPPGEVTKYDIGVPYGEFDFEKVREEGQGFVETLGFGAARLGLTTGTKFLSGVSSLGEFVVNTGRAIAQQSLDPYADTPVSGAFNSLEESIKEGMPIYNDSKDRDKNFLLRAATDLDFWADDMADGTAFIASAWLTGYGATKLLGPATKALYASRLEKASKLAVEELVALEEAAAAGNLEAAQILKDANALQSTKLASNITNAEKFITSGISRSVESLAEGKQTYDSVYNDLLKQGYTEDKAKTEAAKAAMLTTGLNALLMPLDYQQYSGWFKTYSKSRDALLKVGKEGALEVAIPSMGRAFAKHGVENAFSEGILEEGLQRAMQEYSFKSYANKFAEGEDAGAIMGTLKEYLEGFTTKEGWDAMGAGIILGGLFGAITNAYGKAGKQAREQATYLQNLVQNNDYLKSNMSDFVVTDQKTGEKKINSAKVLGLISQQVKDGYFSKEMVKALGNDYEEAYKTLDNIRFANWAYSHFEAGMGEHLMEKIENLGTLSAKELREQGYIYDDMKNSEGKEVTPQDLVERYKQKAAQYEQLYNQVNSRFNIPNRAVSRKLFDEAVLQKEAAVSLEKISGKISGLQSKIASIAQDMGTPEFVEEFEPRDTKNQSMDEKELIMLNNRRKDLINTLKDSYKRVDEITNPKELAKEQEKEAAVQKTEEALKTSATKEKEKKEAVAKSEDAEVANFFNDHSDKIFRDVVYDDKGSKKDFQFAVGRDGKLDPNTLVSTDGKIKLSTKVLIGQFDPSKTFTAEQYEKAILVEDRIKAIDSLINEDRERSKEVSEKILEIQNKELLDLLIDLEELQKYKRGKDSKYRRIGVAGSKVYTEGDYIKALDKLTTLKSLYEEQIAQLETIVTEISDNINYLTDYASYLKDENVSVEEKLNSLGTFQEKALNDMIEYSDKTLPELRKLFEENSQILEVAKERLRKINVLIDVMKDILKRKKFERAAIAARLDQINNLEEFLDTVPREYLGDLQQGDLDFLRYLFNKEELNPMQQGLINERARIFIKEHPEIADMAIAVSEETKKLSAQKELLAREIKELGEELALPQGESAELEDAIKQYTEIVDYTSKAVPALADAEALQRNLNRIIKAFEGIKTISEKRVEAKKANAVQAVNKKAQEKDSGDSKHEPTNLEDEDLKGFKDFSDPIRDILDVLGGTAGSNVKGLSDALTDDPVMRRWFKVTENLNPQDGNYYLRAVSKKNNPFGSEVSFYDDTTVLFVLYKNQEPVTSEGRLVYTTMHLTPNLEEVAKKYTNKSEADLEPYFEFYEQLRNKILNSEEPVYFAVTDKSSGVIKKTDDNGNPLTPRPALNRVVETEKQLSDVPVIIVEGDTISYNGKLFNHKFKKRGFVLIGHKGTLINANIASMKDIPGAVDFLAENIMKMFDAKDNNELKKLYYAVKSQILFGNIKGSDASKFRIFYDSEKKAVFFNGTYHTKETIQPEELKEFLGNKLFNVSKKMLSNTKTYTDPLTGKQYANYKTYLMSSEGRPEQAIPLKVKLPTIGEQQFRSVYLRFNFQLPLSTTEQIAEAQPIVVETSVESSNFDAASIEAMAASNMISNEALLAEAAAEASFGAITTINFDNPVVTTTSVDTTEASTTDTTPSDSDVLSGFGEDTSDPVDDPDELKKIYENEDPASKEELDAEEAWFKEAFPKFANDYARIKGILSGNAVGKVTSMGQVLISDLAARGTTYHEAWHVVTQFLLTPEERKALYDSYNERTGQTLDYDTAEESLAEEFRSFMLTGEVNIPDHRTLFEKILSIIKDFFLELIGKNPKNLEKIFKNIKTGKFANNKLVSKPGRSFNKISNRTVDFTIEFNNVLTKTFLDIAFKSKDFSIEAMHNLEKIKIEDLQEQLFNTLRNTFISQNFSDKKITGVPIDVQKANPKMTPEQWAKVPNKAEVSSIWKAALNLQPFFDTKNPEAREALRKEAISEFKRHLAQFGLNIYSKEFMDPENIQASDPEARGRDFPAWIDSIKFNSKNGLSNPVKMLLFSLSKREFVTNSKSERVSVPKRSDLFKVPISDNFDEIINYLQDKLSGSTTLTEMYQTLNNLRTTKAFIPELLLKLKLEGPGIEGPLSTTLTKDQTALQIEFFQQFAKTKHTYLLTMFNPETGEVYRLDSTGEAVKDKMISRWKAASKSDIDAGKSAYELKNGRYVFSTDRYNKFVKSKIVLPGTTLPVPFNPTDFSHVLEALKFLGVHLTKKSTSYNAAEKKIVTDAYAAIKNYYITGNNEMDEMFEADSIRSSINALAKLELGYTDEVLELSHQNPDGETVYSITLNNYLSTVINKIKKQGLGAIPQIANDPTIKNSVWAEILKKNPNALELVLLEGLKTINAPKSGQSHPKLSPTDLLVTSVNALMDDVYPLMRSADRGLEYGFKIKMPDIDTEFKNYLKGYLTDELNRVVSANEGQGEDIAFYKDQAKKLQMFYFLNIKNLGNLKKADIPAIVNSKEVSDQLDAYLLQQYKDNSELLFEYKVIDKKASSYTNMGVSTKFLSKNPTAAEVADFVKKFTVRSLIGNIEQTKMFLGDLAFYDHSKNEFNKRVNGSTGTKKIAVTGAEVDNYLNAQYSREDKISDGRLKVITFSDPILNGSEYVKELDKFLKLGTGSAFYDPWKEDVKTADGQGYMTVPEYREFKVRMGTWTKAHERSYAKVMAGSPLTASEFALWVPEKPQYFGPQNYWDSTNYMGYQPKFLKFSIIPLLPSVLKSNPELSKLNKLMLDNGIGVATFLSGNKVGAVVNSLDEFNKDPEAFEPVSTEIGYEYFGTQLDIAPEHKYFSTFGTQFRKLLPMGLMAEGLGKSIRVLNRETGKLENKDSKELVKSFNDSVEFLVKTEYDKLLKDLDIQKSGSKFIINDVNKFKDHLVQEALKRGISDNALVGIIESLTTLEPSLDSLSNKIKIENILMSLVNNNLVNQKTPGEMRIQVSGYGYEKPKVTKNKNLKMYSPDPATGKIGMAEIMLPHYFKEKYGKEVNIEDIDPKLLEIAGFRIPTGGLNAMEAFKIVGFLPPEAGNIVVVPELYPVKSGSDFDVDKETLMFPNYKVVKDEKTGKKTFVYVSPSENTKEGHQNRMLDTALQIITSPDNFKALVTPTTSDTLKQIAKEVAKSEKKLGQGRVLEFKTNFNTTMEYLVGKEGIGIAALNNTHHVLSQQVGLYVPKDITIEIMGGIAVGTPEIALPHNKINGGISFSAEMDVFKKNSISDMIGEFLSAYVDVTKEAFILALNAGTDTANVWFMLVRAGVPVKTAAYFMNQPIIKDIYKNLKIYRNSQLFAPGEIYKSDIITSVAASYGVIEEGTNSRKMAEKLMNLKVTPMTEESLKKNMTADPKDSVNMNARILAEFLKYDALGEDLANIQRATTFDTAGVGKTRWESRSAIANAEIVLADSYFANAPKLLTDTVLKPFYDISAKTGASLYDSLYAIDIEKAAPLVDRLMDFVNLKSSVEDRAKALSYAENEFITFLLSTVVVNDAYKGSGKVLGNDFRRLFTGEESLAHRLQKIQGSKKYKNNLLLKELVPVINVNRASTDNIKLYDAFFDSYQEDLFLQAFDELFNAPEPEIRDFANDLMKLMILQGGVNRSIDSLYKLIPNSRFIPALSKVVISHFKNSAIDISAFYDEMFLNSWNNNDMVPYVKINKRNNFFGTTMHVGSPQQKNYPYIRTRVYKPGFTSKQIDVMKEQKVPQDVYSEMALFKNTGMEVKSKVVFERVSRRGNGSLGKEYYGDASVLSALPVNNFQSSEKIKTTLTTSVSTTPQLFAASQPAVQTSQIDFKEDQNTGYATRTRINASADATIALAYDFNSAGEKLTKNSVKSQNKQYIGIPIPKKEKASKDLKPDQRAVDFVVNKLNEVNAKTLNIAGNGIYTMREANYSQNDVDEMTYQLLKAVLESPNLKNKIESIRTGGQTGFDEAGAKAGIKLGIPTTILAPKGWKFRNISGTDISNEQLFKARFATVQPAAQPATALSVSTDAQALWNQYGKALTEKFGPGMKDVWLTKDAEWRAYKIKCL